LFELLGEGSYGTVHKAKRHSDGTVVAVKILSMEGAENEEELRNELEILRKCVHPSVVSYFGSYLNGGDLWIAMEYCGTGSVRDLLDALKYYTNGEDGTPLTEVQIAAILAGMLRGLEYLHSNRMIHRDIKAGNVLLTEDGGCKLADFGVSAQLHRTLSQRKTLCGSPYWMAPEVIREEPYDGRYVTLETPSYTRALTIITIHPSSLLLRRADIWSLGIVAIEMAQGVPPLNHVHPVRAIFMVTKVQCSTVQCSTVHYSTVQCSTVTY
jgi:serine/threonine protein kinase